MKRPDAYDRMATAILLRSMPEHKAIANACRRLFADLHQEFGTARGCKELVGKSEAQVRAIVSRKLKAVWARQPKLIF